MIKKFDEPFSELNKIANLDFLKPSDPIFQNEYVNKQDLINWLEAIDVLPTTTGLGLKLMITEFIKNFPSKTLEPDGNIIQVKSDCDCCIHCSECVEQKEACPAFRSIF